MAQGIVALNKSVVLSPSFHHGSGAHGWRTASGTFGRGADFAVGRTPERRWSRRAAWRITTSVEHEGETEGNDENLIPSASTGEQKMFYYKMKGGYYRFLAEFATGDPENEVAQEGVDMPVVLQRQVTTIQRTHKTWRFHRCSTLARSSMCCCGATSSSHRSSRAESGGSATSSIS